jgi:galactokinase
MTFKNIKLKLRATLIFNPLQVRGGGGGGGGCTVHKVRIRSCCKLRYKVRRIVRIMIVVYPFSIKKSSHCLF